MTTLGTGIQKYLLLRTKYQVLYLRLRTKSDWGQILSQTIIYMLTVDHLLYILTCRFEMLCRILCSEDPMQEIITYIMRILRLQPGNMSQMIQIIQIIQIRNLSALKVLCHQPVKDRIDRVAIDGQADVRIVLGKLRQLLKVGSLRLWVHLKGERQMEVNF